MATPRLNVTTNTIVKVLIREVGWVDIEPGSLRYLYVNYMIHISDQEPLQSAGYEYPAFEYVDAHSGAVFYIQSDNIIGIQVAPVEQQEGS